MHLTAIQSWEKLILKKKQNKNIVFQKECNLKNEQSVILKCILEGKDCFVNLSTGFGESLCFILPPLLKEEV